MNDKLIKCLVLCLADNLNNTYINETNYRDYILQKTGLLDILINDEDYYSQNLSSLATSKWTVFGGDNFKNLLDDNLNYISEVNQKILSDKTNLIEKIFLDYFSTIDDIDENTFYDQIDSALKDLKDFLSNILCSEENQEINPLYQIQLYKMGLFHEITRLITKLNYSSNLKKKLEESQNLDYIFERILKILILISDQNPFLISLFFNKSFLKVIISTEDVSNQIIAFLLKSLKTLHNFKYKIDCKVLIDKLIPMMNKVL